jgi:long-chain fatty acid transport protein
VEGVNIGIDYRSKIIMKMEDGDAEFNIPSSLSTTIPATNKFNAELPLPGNLDFGLSIDLSEKWLLAFELNWIFWETYDSLVFTFQDQGDLLDSSNPRLYKNTIIPRIGAEFKLNDMFTFRGGAYYDPTPTDENYFTPETVSLNTVALTFGLSIVPVEGLSIDLSYLQLFGLESEKSYMPDGFEGTYKTLSYIPGLGVSYNF